ncbi:MULTISPECIES: response regulator transcription factor [Pseudofrankia]|uniref:response regulator transcription factor n=1 Tax=Pseudofrankia TaxID=2994363 RepID=UPI000234B685|nr:MULTISPECIES: LuxR C-terminal-related transcriptional regulator [Pseudofrankia]OHV40556.1 hypothetical protein BCD49_08265 [Pseudofrankia sp. EUN1h]
MMSDRRKPAEFDRLSEREKAILSAMAEGRSNQGIAQQLNLSPKTVENYLTAIFSKLGLENSGDHNRRVLATLLWLRVDRQHAPVLRSWDMRGPASPSSPGSPALDPVRSSSPPPPARSR